MSANPIATQLIDALEAAAQREAGSAMLVSITIDITAPGSAGAVAAHLVRRTKTLVFMSAELTGADGAKLAVAASVHKLPA